MLETYDVIINYKIINDFQMTRDRVESKYLVRKFLDNLIFSKGKLKGEHRHAIATCTLMIYSN